VADDAGGGITGACNYDGLIRGIGEDRLVSLAKCSGSGVAVATPAVKKFVLGRTTGCSPSAEVCEVVACTSQVISGAGGVLELEVVGYTSGGMTSLA